MIERRAFALASVLLLALGSSPAFSQNDEKTIFKRIIDGVTRFELSNGLRVLVYRRRRAPVFSAQVWVKVGGVDEVPEKAKTVT